MRLLNKKPPPHCPYPRSQQGITLIELMIALVIGLLATGAMLKVYVDSSRLYRFNESLARIQENGRFGLEFIRRDARMAGFWGCNHDVTPTNRIASSEDLYPDFVLSGISGTNGSESIEPDEPDSITFAGARRSVGMLKKTLANTEAKGNDFRVKSTERIKKDDALLISDCKTSDIFYVTRAEQRDKRRKLWHDTPQNTSDSLSTEYETLKSKLFRVQQTTFCIVPDPDPAQRSLRRLVNQKDTETCLTDGDELVEGIENMQILMGEDTDGDGSANRYCPPLPSVVCKGLDMDRVVSVRISLLAVSPYNNVTTEPAPYFFNGVMVDVVDPDDRYLRKEFTTTVALRNKNQIRNTTPPLPTVAVDACFAPAMSGGVDIMWKERALSALTSDQLASATACWDNEKCTKSLQDANNGECDGWVVGCNTVSSVCGIPDGCPGGTASGAECPNNWPWPEVRVGGVKVGYKCGGSNKTQSVVQAHASSELCSDGENSKPKCKKVNVSWSSSKEWTPCFVSGDEFCGRFGGVGYACCHSSSNRAGIDGKTGLNRDGCQNYLDKEQGTPKNTLWYD